MKMRTSLVICFLIAEVFFVLADHKVTSKTSILKKVDDVKQEDATQSDIDFLADGKSLDAQRKQDPGYYYSRSNQFPFRNNNGFGKHGYRGRIVTRLQNQINRPFKQYGPPNQEGHSLKPESVQPTTPSNLINQGIPSPIRWNDFAEESPIASQNNEPFGQHTANYLPPKNQKLPMPSSHQLFSNINHDFPDHQQPQLHLQHQQEQLTSQQLQQRPQLQVDNQNFVGQDFNALNQNFGQNEFTDQQISDATLFLTQNAQAISNLYGAPAPNQNYAPNNQEFEQQQQFQPSLNIQVSNAQTQGFPGQLPSYATGILNPQESFQNVQSLEKDRLIAQLQQALSNREKSARLVQNINNNNDFGQAESLAAASSQFSTIRAPNSFIPSTTLSTLNFQGYYGSSTPVTSTTQAPVAATPTTTTTTTTTVQPSQGSSGSGSTQIGTSLPAPGSFKPTVVNPVYSQYGGFVPTFISPGFVPSIPTYGTTLFPATALKPAENSPTHFGIPIPTFQGQKPARPTQPASTTPTTTQPPSHTPSRPSTPTFSIDLGPVRPVGTPVQPPVIKPNPVPVFPAATPIHPTYGLHPAVVNPGFVYKPVKVVPVYYYPNVAYQHLQKPVAAAVPTQPWSYAPSYAQAKPLGIWK